MIIINFAYVIAIYIYEIMIVILQPAQEKHARFQGVTTAKWPLTFWNWAWLFAWLAIFEERRWNIEKKYY